MTCNKTAWHGIGLFDFAWDTEIGSTDERLDKLDFKELLRTKKAVLFDLDGTLVDSMWLWGKIDVAFLAQHGIACPPDLEDALEGKSFDATAHYFKERFDLPMSPGEIRQTWVDMAIEAYRTAVPLKTGALRFLQYLDRNGIKAGIATSNGIEMVDAVIDAKGVRPYFQAIVTGCEVGSSKPAPDIYLEAARRLGVEAADCIVFEDIPAGIMAGKNAGMTVFAMEDEFSKGMEEKKRTLADGYFADFHEAMGELGA